MRRPDRNDKGTVAVEDMDDTALGKGNIRAGKIETDAGTCGKNAKK